MPIGPITDGAVVVAGVAIPVIEKARTKDDVGAAYLAVVTLPISALFLIPTIYGAVQYKRCVIPPSSPTLKHLQPSLD